MHAFCMFYLYVSLGYQFIVKSTFHKNNKTSNPEKNSKYKNTDLFKERADRADGQKVALTFCYLFWPRSNNLLSHFQSLSFHVMMPRFCCRPFWTNLCNACCVGTSLNWSNYCYWLSYRKGSLGILRLVVKSAERVDVSWLNKVKDYNIWTNDSTTIRTKDKFGPKNKFGPQTNSGLILKFGLKYFAN